MLENVMYLPGQPIKVKRVGYHTGTMAEAKTLNSFFVSLLQDNPQKFMALFGERKPATPLNRVTGQAGKLPADIAKYVGTNVLHWQMTDKKGILKWLFSGIPEQVDAVIKETLNLTTFEGSPIFVEKNGEPLYLSKESVTPRIRQLLSKPENKLQKWAEDPEYRTGIARDASSVHSCGVPFAFGLNLGKKTFWHELEPLLDYFDIDVCLDEYKWEVQKTDRKYLCERVNALCQFSTCVPVVENLAEKVLLARQDFILEQIYQKLSKCTDAEIWKIVSGDNREPSPGTGVYMVMHTTTDEQQFFVQTEPGKQTEERVASLLNLLEPVEPDGFRYCIEVPEQLLPMISLIRPLTIGLGSETGYTPQTKK